MEEWVGVGGENVYEGGGRRWECEVGGEGRCGAALGAGCVCGVKCRRDGAHVLSCAFCIRDGVHVFGLGFASGCSCGVFVCK